MMRRFLSLSFILLSIIVPSQAQVVYEMKECIKIGLERNFSLLITKNNEIISKNNFTIGNAGYLPSLDLSSRHTGTINDVKRNLTDGTQTVSEGEHNTATAGAVSLGLTIFDGFSVNTTYKKLGELRQIGELNSQMAIENLIADIISGYVNYIQQVQLYKNLNYAVTLSKERLRIDEDRYLLGSSSKLQVLQSRVYLNSDSSRLSKQHEIVRAAQIRLNELMAVEDIGVRFESKDTSISIIQDLIYENLLEETLIKNTSLLIASKNKIISDYDRKLVMARSYPYLTANSGYSYTLNSYSASTTRSQITNGLNYGVTLGFNIFDGLNQQRSIRNSVIDVQNKELKYKEVEQGVRADLLTVYSAYSNYLRLITLEQQNLETATENLEIAMERYKLGNLSGIDLREVQKSLLDARESLLSVQYQAKLAEISLLMISGRIMEYYK